MNRQCENLEGCRFFEEELKSLPATANMYLTYFCLADHRACARKMVVSLLGRDAVPSDLYPNQTARARKILSER